MENDKKLDNENKTDWGFMKSILKDTASESTSIGRVTRLSESANSLDKVDGSSPGVPALAVPDKDAARGILMKYRENKLNRKATLKALEATYKTQLDALTHNLSRALQVKKTETDVIAEEYLKELDARHMEVMIELGLRNVDIRSRTLEKLNDQAVAKIKEVQNKDWPPEMIEQTLELMNKLRMRFIAEMMTEVGLDYAGE